MNANPTAQAKVAITGPLYSNNANGPAEIQPHSIALPHPAIEALPEYLGTIDSRLLQPGARHYNGSICRHGSRVFMAYRFEQFNAVSLIGIAELNADFSVIRDQLAPIPLEDSVHYEDPRLTTVGDNLVLQFAHVRLGVPPVCRQRMAIIGTGRDGFTFEKEIPLTFGGHGIEKNWSPFELPNGNTGLVYGQKPRLVIEVETRAGHWSHELAPAPEGSSISGRTPPLRITDGLYLEFIGGHVRSAHRNTRYWFGAQLFQAGQPHRVVAATGPMVWGTEASPTLYSPRPHAGHPLCIFPSGVMIEGEDVIVSCGVNDSYIALLRYNLTELLAKMNPVAAVEK